MLASLDANVTLQEIDSKPTSRAKNFMIWQYLKQDITPEQADKAYAQIKGKSNKLFKLYAKKTNNPQVKKKISCMKEKKLLSIEDDKCLELAFSPYKTLAMTKNEREKLSKKIKTKAKIELLRIQNEPYSQEAYSKYDANTILSLFVRTTSRHRRENLNIHLNNEFINKLSSSWRISQFVKIVVHDDRLNRLQLALLNLEGEKLNSKTNFYLALNHIKYLNNKAAIHYFNLSLLKAKKKIDIDKNYFWMYKVTEDKKYLDKLLHSRDINMYTLQ
jgi:soluble lytic murein transglycosylase